MAPYGNSGPASVYEDQTIATAGGTYIPGGIPFTMTKCAAILAGTIEAITLGAGIVVTPVQSSENGQVATFQFWEQNGSTGALVEFASGSAALIGKKVRFSYQPAA